MNSKKKWTKILLVLGVVIALAGVSYALWVVSLSGKNTNKLTASCFNVSFTDQNNISLEKAYPLLDEEGKKLTPYEFTITNNCDSYVKYDINLEILNNSTLTNMDYIKLILDDETPTLVSSYDVTTKTLSNASSAYKIKTSYLEAKESKTYSLRLWLDENVTGETEGVQNNTFASKITVNASYAESAPEYCELNPNTAACQITALAETDTTNLSTDDYGNTRYIGSNPNNYVSIDGELWRIIGVMKDIDDGTGTKSNRIKMVRNESIGNYSWDTSDSSVNHGYGVNEWSQADLMKLLNPGYESESVGGSLYWNSRVGTCYAGENDETTSCDFTSTGIKNKLKYLIGDAVWNTGAVSSVFDTASVWYKEERGNTNGKICSTDSWCNDTVARKTTWTGKVGLMYPSDYGYATSGGSTTDRTTCLNISLYGWSNYSDCDSNDWLNSSEWPWALTALAHNSASSMVYFIFFDDGVTASFLEFYTIFHNYQAFPTVYLKSSVKISSGIGSQSDPFTLEI